MKVEIQIHNVKSRIIQPLPEQVNKALRSKLSAELVGAFFARRANPYAGVKYFYTPKTQMFPTGMLSIVREILDKYHIEYDHVDCRPAIQLGLELPLHNVMLRDYQQEAVNLAVQKQRGIIRAGTGCHAKGTKILMFDGSLKNVEDIQVGDRLMGPDSTDREVLQLCYGKEEMFEIKPTKGSSFIVNKNHILSLKKTRRDSRDKFEYPFIDISIEEYLKTSPKFKYLHKLYRVPITFNVSHELVIPPYILGLWLGDGSSKFAALTTMDKEILDAWSAYGKTLGLDIRRNAKRKNNKCATFYLIKGIKGKPNPFMKLLKKLNLFQNKHIPYEYLISSRETRLSLLAGLIDTDGYLGNKYYQISTKYDKLRDDILFLARSLGFLAISKTEYKKCQTGKGGFYHRIHIMGDGMEVPVLLERKKQTKRLQKKNVLKTGFSIKSIGFGEYFGFYLNKNHRYLTEDFIVHHNSGKSTILSAIIGKLNVPTLLLIHKTDVFYQLISTLERILQVPVGKIGDGFCELDKKITVGMIQSLAHVFDPKVKIAAKEDKILKQKTEDIKQYLNRLNAILVDEAHHVSADSFWMVLQNMENAFYRIGVTATAFREDNMDIMLEGALAQKFVDISSSDLIDRGFLVQPTIYLYPVEQERRQKGDPYSLVYNEGIVNNVDRNHLICNLALKAKQTGKAVLISVLQIEHGEILEKMLQSVDKDAVFVNGQSKSEIRKQILEDLGKGIVRIVIASNIYSEGCDMPSLSVLINATGAASGIHSLQLLGRVLRTAPNKTKAWVVDLQDTGKFLNNHSKERVSIYQTEPRYQLVPVKSIEEVKFE